MQIENFKRIASTFADPEAELIFEGRRAVLQVSGDLIEVNLRTEAGEVIVEENGVSSPANQWIINRLARLSLLADRLISQIPQTKPFVAPEADVTKTLEMKNDAESAIETDALEATRALVDDKSPMETMVVYITSDAGEGKTSLINQLASEQAKRFKEKKTDRLVVPIPLGGRNFLRFDDIVVGALANRYRFPNLYYDSFLELVRMDVIVPAFDGFEEMFVEKSTGEAFSAMGSLVNALHSQGTVIVAARTAYFEFQDLRAQARLYDTISTNLVGFSKVSLRRWNKSQFLKYCEGRDYKQSENLYNHSKNFLGENHPLITRPVLIKNLVNIASEGTIEEFLAKLHAAGADYFSAFVRGIIERESTEKWVDRSGEVAQPLLSVEEHCDLLSSLALEMWQSRVDYLKLDMVEFVSDYFSETKRFSASQTHQVRERIKGHALLVHSGNAQGTLEFDHDEFRQYFLGEAIAKLCLSSTSSRKADLLAALRKGILPATSLSAITHAFSRAEADVSRRGLELLRDTALLDGQTSFAHENCASLILPIISAKEISDIALSRMAFPAQSLQLRKLKDLVFEDCYFSQTNLEHTTLDGCTFERCSFSRLDIHPSITITDSEFVESSVECVFKYEGGLAFYDPNSIKAQLKAVGFQVHELADASDTGTVSTGERDEEIQQFEKLLRYFSRSTHMSESVILMKLGGRARYFIEETMPILERVGALKEIANRGGSNQRRFKLDRSMSTLNTALEKCSGSFDAFLKLIESSNSETE